MKEIPKLIVIAIKNILAKAGSFKNLVFLFATLYGGKMALELGAEFKLWAGYQVVLLVLFYTSNQFQKWIFTHISDKVK